MPLILVSMIAAVVRMDEIATLGKIGGMVIGILIATTMIASLVAITVTNIFGLTAEGLTQGARELARAEVLEVRRGTVTDLSFPQIIVSFIPQNIFADLAGSRPTSIISVVIFGILTGIAGLLMTRDEPEQGERFKQFVETAQTLVLKLVRMVIIRGNIDEAYIDFASDEYDSVPLIFEHDNLVILRTLSKGYSLAGLRFGYGIGTASLITPMLEKTRDSFNLDLFSQLIAESAISNHQYAAANCRKIIAERERLRDLLMIFEFEIEPSQTNFLLATLPAVLKTKSTNSAEELYIQLKSRGILVRYFPEKRLKNKLRITVGTAQQNDLLVRAIESLL